ncbi:hypothetical protein [Chamaesiphon sp.]|uniref:NACHT C-terminal helical domain 2-containing protein n=1 Tax=Chamaesiphon sp. TaxID=2814140 RepID=UPI0035941D14
MLVKFARIKIASLSIEFKVYKGLDFQSAIAHSENLETEIPDNKQSMNVYRAFTQKPIETWLKTFYLTLEMVSLSKEEINSLENYLYTNLLLIECKRSAVMRLPELWDQIEDRMLRVVLQD